MVEVFSLVGAVFAIADSQWLFAILFGVCFLFSDGDDE